MVTYVVAGVEHPGECLALSVVVDGVEDGRDDDAAEEAGDEDAADQAQGVFDLLAVQSRVDDLRPECCHEPTERADGQACSDVGLQSCEL